MCQAHLAHQSCATLLNHQVVQLTKCGWIQNVRPFVAPLKLRLTIKLEQIQLTMLDFHWNIFKWASLYLLTCRLPSMTTRYNNVIFVFVPHSIFNTIGFVYVNRFTIEATLFPSVLIKRCHKGWNLHVKLNLQEPMNFP